LEPIPRAFKAPAVVAVVAVAVVAVGVAIEAAEGIPGAAAGRGKFADLFAGLTNGAFHPVTGILCANCLLAALGDYSPPCRSARLE